MADQTPQEKKPSEINRIDLSALAGFSFGTQWTEASSSRSSAREAEGRDERGHRGGGEVRRDRRPARRPSGGASGDLAGAGAGEAGAAFAPDRREHDRGREGGGPERGPRGSGGGRFDRRFGGERGARFERGGPRGQQDHRPYVSPFFDAAFYAEDAGFAALVKAIRASCRTYELFEIARVILGKSERFVVVVTRKPDEQGLKQPLWVTPMDGLAFETEDDAVRHVMERHVGEFFDLAEVEVEPPKGNYQFVVRCGYTGELLGPPNYHRYQAILQQHHAARLSRIPFERFKERLETVREPEMVQQWLERMKKTVQYTWKAAVETGVAPVFTALEDARTYLLAHARDRIVKQADSARFHGRLIEALPHGEIRRAIEGHLERQRRFPLDTANALRGRLRREGFTIFKKGSKGVSYVCAVKRKFRLPGQVFSPTITALIAFIEANQMVNVRDLPVKFLGLEPLDSPDKAAVSSASASAAAAGSPAASTGEGSASEGRTDAAVSPAETGAEASTPPTAGVAAPAAPSLSPEDEARLRKMWFDLRWLVTEGYVTEFSDGKLYACPPAAPPSATEKAGEGVEAEDQADFPSASDISPEVAPADEVPVSGEASAGASASADAVAAPGAAEAEATAASPHETASPETAAGAEAAGALEAPLERKPGAPAS